MLKKYLAVGKVAFKTSLAYRLRFMSSIVISPIMLFMMYAVWSAIYQNNSEALINGYDFSSMISYYVVIMIIGHFIFNTVGNDMQQRVIYGELNQDLLKPMSVFSKMLSGEAAKRSFAFVVEVIPVFVLSYFFFDVQVPAILNFLLFSAALMMAFIINFLLSFLTGILAFWIQNIESIQWLMFFIVRFLSGEFIPLEFIGGLGILKLLPFYYLRFGVAQIFLMRVDIYGAVITLFVQIVWIILLYLLIKFAWHFALRKYGGEGG